MKRYLSRVWLTLDHRAVMKAFEHQFEDGEKSVRAKHSILFRVDGKATLVQSAIAPNWGEFFHEKVFEVKEAEIPVFETGTELVFRLAFSPVQRVESPGSQRRIRKTVSPHQWMISRQTHIGAALSPQEVEQDFTEESSSEGHRVPVKKITASGLLTVTDGDKFQNVLGNGIGRHRAYGCGMLTVASI